MVSIIIPTYNRASFLKNTILDLFNQTHDSIEIIVVDDGSSDETPEIINDLSKVINESFLHINLRYYFIKNQGAPVARNLGLKKAKGEFVVFHDSDDFMHPDRIRIQLKEMLNTSTNGNNCSIYDFDSKTCMYSAKIEYKDNILAFFKGKLHGGTQAWMYKKNAILDIGGYDISLVCHQDIDLTFRFLAAGNKVSFSPKAISYFLQHNNNRISVIGNTLPGLISIWTSYIKEYNFVLDKRNNQYYKQILKRLFFLRISFIMKNNYKTAIKIWFKALKGSLALSTFTGIYYNSFSASVIYAIVKKILKKNI